MRIIAHRKNTVAGLAQSNPAHGVEIDIRTYGGKLVLHHDPFARGEDFALWLKHYRHKTLILNVKEEGLEDSVLELMRAHALTDFFFLDQSMPFLLKTAKSGERRCAVRVSEYESIASALSLAGLVDWIWVDCFTRFPLSYDDAARLREAGFRLCLVSPELQGRNPDAEIPALRTLLAERRIVAEAVCTKRPDLWQA